MRFSELFGYWDFLMAFFFAFKTLDTVVGVFLYWI